MKTMVAQIRSLLGREDGVAAIELGLAAPILALMAVGIADLSNAYSRKLALEQAAQRSIEKNMQTTGTRAPVDELKAEAVAQAGGGLTTADVTVRYTLYCVSSAGAFTKKDNFDTDTCASGSSEARYLEVVVTDDYTPMFPLRVGPVNTRGNYVVRAVAGMRTQ